MRTAQHVPFFLMLLAALVISACSSRRGPSVEELEAHAVEASQEYVIGPKDTLNIQVWHQPTLSLGAVVVRLDGKISFPLLDDVQAAGLSAMELKGVITEGLDEFIKAPHVTVIVTLIRSKHIFIMGEVARPGAIALESEMRLADALSLSGGFRTFAAKKRVKLIRDMNGSGPVEFIFDYNRFESGADLEQNILLLPGDTIVVPEQTGFWN